MSALRQNASAQNAITATAGGGQANAFQLNASISRVTTVATAADSVKLPKAINGKIVIVGNAAAVNAMNVFPTSGDSINALAADAAYSMTANKACVFFCAADGVWMTAPA